jgi:hypothetical protein
MAKKLPLESRIAAAYQQRFGGLPSRHRRAIRKVMILNGGLLAVFFGLACAIALALFMMGMARGLTLDQGRTAVVTGILCVSFGGLSWVGWLMNRVGKLLRW